MGVEGLLEVVDKGAGEPVGEEAGEFLPEGGGVVEVDEVDQFVGEDFFHCGKGKGGEGAVEFDLAVLGAVSENARPEGSNLD